MNNSKSQEDDAHDEAHDEVISTMTTKDDCTSHHRQRALPQGSSPPPPPHSTNHDEKQHKLSVARFTTIVVLISSSFILLLAIVFPDLKRLLLAPIAAIIAKPHDDEQQAPDGRRSACLVDYQGHRGSRGIMPENSIPAFIKALDLSVDTLELDCVISKDMKVVVSHDPYLNHQICLGPDGEAIESEAVAKRNYNIYQMEYHSQIERCDCGSMGNVRFPDQAKMKVHKPLLSQVFDQMEQYMRDRGLRMKQVRYNIETKSHVDGDDIFHPKPEVFVSLLYDVLREKNMTRHVMIQSFDVRTLQVMRTVDARIPLALLVEREDQNSTEPFDYRMTLDQLGFLPDIYSPHYSLVTNELVSFMHQNNVKVVPWTANNQALIDELVHLGVDGIITDYPNITTNRCDIEVRKRGG